MSGGYFEYLQSRMRYDIADSIDDLIITNNDETLNRWGEKRGYFYPPEIIEKFKEAAHCVRQAAEMAQRVDWLVSGDDGEESFLERWDKEVREYYKR